MSEWIVCDPEVLGGKPCVRETRITVEFILELFASGADRGDILARYPQIGEEGLEAALGYAARVMKNEVVWNVSVPA